MKNKKFLILIIPMLLILFFLGIHSMSLLGNTDKNIVIALKEFKKGDILDPSLIAFTAEYIYLENLTVRLIGLDSSALYVNQLAEELKFENEKKDVYIKLKDAFFSDGTPIKAVDVINTLKRVIIRGSPHSNPKSFIRGAENLKSIDQEIEGLRVVDKNTIFIGLNHKMKELLYYLQLADYGILHPKQYRKEKLTTEDWVTYSSGPYSIDFDSKNVIQLIANKQSIFYHADMPKKVSPAKVNDNTIFEDLKNEKIHLGKIPFLSYVKNMNKFESMKEVSFFGGVFNSIDYIVLNVKSKKFQNPLVRQWIQKKIMKGFQIKEDQKKYMQKAYQYFLLGAKGYVAEAETISLLPDDINLEEVPLELKHGIVLKTVPGMKKFLPDGFKEDLESVLGINIDIEFDIPNEKYAEVVGRREHDAILMATSMSYKVVGETLNLLYTSINAEAIDPTGKIKLLLSEYQKEDDIEKESVYVNKILKQMIVDSEVIPLFYLISPIFYNNSLLDVSDVNMEESMQFWRLRVKK